MVNILSFKFLSMLIHHNLTKETQMVQMKKLFAKKILFCIPKRQ